MPTTPRYEEVLLHRQELEEAKRENERLRRRVRELEAMVRGRIASSVSTRDGGVSANASASVSEAERERSVSVRRGREGSGEGGSG
jgi:transcription elongation GreA/GreB family factor